MLKSITIRDVPAETGRELAARAAATGRSLQEYLRAHLIELASRPEPEVVVARLRARKESLGTASGRGDPLPQGRRSPMSRVLDASVVVAALVDGGEDGRWAEGMLLGDHLAAPHHLPSEVANILRRATLGGQIFQGRVGPRPHRVADPPHRLLPLCALCLSGLGAAGYRDPYDTWCVALAEALDADLATLDRRLVRAPGPRCGFLTR